jgi:hypothetical protein
VAVEGLRRIKGPITRDAYVDALNSIRKFDTIGGELNYSAADHHGICCQFIWQAKADHWVTVPGTKVDGAK